MIGVGRSRTLALALGLAGLAGGCVVPSGGPVPPRVEVLAGAPGAAVFGATAAEILAHPALRAEVQALFGAPGVGLSAPPEAFFVRSARPARLRIGGTEYIAVSGCGATGCAARRGLLLVGDSGARLYARLDDGGFTRHYGFGPGMGALTPADRALIDAAARALEAAGLAARD